MKTWYSLFRIPYNKGIFSSDFGASNFPLVMQTFHFNTRDPVNNLLLFDVDSLLGNIIIKVILLHSCSPETDTLFLNSKWT